MTKTSFNSENLKVDYLSFNLQFNNLTQINIIANWLANTFHCRNRLIDQSTKKRYILTEITKNLYLAEFVVNSNSYWKGSWSTEHHGYRNDPKK